jgi:hypothetical protein
MPEEEYIPRRKELIPMEHQNDAPIPVELSSQLITIMATEHYNLQSGRSMSISKANGRVAHDARFDQYLRPDGPPSSLSPLLPFIIKLLAGLP